MSDHSLTENMATNRLARMAVQEAVWRELPAPTTNTDESEEKKERKFHNEFMSRKLLTLVNEERGNYNVNEFDNLSAIVNDFCNSRLKIYFTEYAPMHAEFLELQAAKKEELTPKEFKKWNKNTGEGGEIRLANYAFQKEHEAYNPNYLKSIVYQTAWLIEDDPELCKWWSYKKKEGDSYGLNLGLYDDAIKMGKKTIQDRQRGELMTYDAAPMIVYYTSLSNFLPTPPPPTAILSAAEFGAGFRFVDISRGKFTIDEDDPTGETLIIDKLHKGGHENFKFKFLFGVNTFFKWLNYLRLMTGNDPQEWEKIRTNQRRELKSKNWKFASFAKEFEIHYKQPFTPHKFKRLHVGVRAFQDHDELLVRVAQRVLGHVRLESSMHYADLKCIITVPTCTYTAEEEDSEIEDDGGDDSDFGPTRDGDALDDNGDCIARGKKRALEGGVDAEEEPKAKFQKSQGVKEFLSHTSA